jgi:hypothetical protein
VILRLIASVRDVPPMRRIAAYLGILALLMPPMPVMAVARLAALFTRHATYSGMPTPTSCRYDVAARALNALPATDMFLPLDIGPDILVRTHQRAVATGHHRGAAGMHDVMAAFLAKPDEARAIIQRRHATLIAVCPDTAEPANYKYYAPNGLMAQLLRGQTPRWLEPVNLAPGSHMLFWRVKMQ